jgi:hypothetical protein
VDVNGVPSNLANAFRMVPTRRRAVHSDRHQRNSLSLVASQKKRSYEVTEMKSAALHCVVLVVCAGATVTISAQRGVQGAISAIPAWPADGNIPDNLQNNYVFLGPRLGEIVSYSPGFTTACVMGDVGLIRFPGEVPMRINGR